MYTYITSLVPEIWEAPIDGQLKIQLFNTAFTIFQAGLETSHLTDSVGSSWVHIILKKTHETILLGDFFRISDL